MANHSHILEPDAQAIFLLCGRFGSKGDGLAKPLTLKQYNEVANWLHQNEMRPANLLEEEGRGRLSEFGDEGKLTEDRLLSLLERGTALAMEVEEWTNKGGWILARSDKNYPNRLRRRLRHLAPPILYGVGDLTLMEHGGVSMVGSRDSSNASLAFVEDLARRCAEEEVPVVSGGARGVDRTSMESALEAGGLVVGALANGLAKAARKKAYREAIADDRLTLVSAYHPNSRFAVWKAMGRNKHIYALGDGTVVAHSAVESGGTWSGATENLEHEWVPLFVYAESPLPEGNRKLIEMGGTPIDRRILRSDVEVREWLSGRISCTGLKPTASGFESTFMNGEGAKERDDSFQSLDTEIVQRLEQLEQRELFPFVWPAIKTLLNEPRSGKDVQEAFEDLRLCQSRDWLMMAAERGLANRQERPVRYVLHGDSPEDGNGNQESKESEDKPKDEGGPISEKAQWNKTSDTARDDVSTVSESNEENKDPGLFDTVD